MSLCLPASRTHFWIDAARGGTKGTGSSARKYGTNCIIPELVNIGAVGWCGISPADGTRVCWRSRQKPFQARRSSSAFIEVVTLPAGSRQVRADLGLALLHGRPSFGPRRPEVLPEPPQRTGAIRGHPHLAEAPDRQTH